MKRALKVLIGCEESGTVRREFRNRGHVAYSCDLLPERHNSKWHFKQDIFEILDHPSHYKWDLIILHPPCTALALSGNSTYGVGMKKHHLRLAALIWTEKLWNRAKEVCPRVMLENPMNVLGAAIGKRSQVIHPYEYGHMEQKETWLWLHGLPPLEPTLNVYNQMMELPRRERERLHYLPPGPNRARERSTTFPGIAKAMAMQWGKL